jgi:hypothetical protein
MMPACPPPAPNPFRAPLRKKPASYPVRVARSRDILVGEALLDFVRSERNWEMPIHSIRMH